MFIHHMVPLYQDVQDCDRMVAKLDKAIEEYQGKQDVVSVIGPDSMFEIKSAY